MKKLILIFILWSSLNSYCQTIIIGTQIWQTRNLDVTTYRDGTPIPQVTDPTAWANLTTGAWCYYNNDANNNTTYGKMYNLYAVEGIYDAASLSDTTLRKNLAPTGYHVPTDAEWAIVNTFLGGESVAGGKMKETGTAHWLSPNTSATNSSGFTGLPGGFRNQSSGTYKNIGIFGYWWISGSSDCGTNAGRVRILGYSAGDALTFCNNYTFGCSVRCLSDNPLSNTTFETSSLEIFPNPVKRVLNVSIDQNLINQQYAIIDGLGRVVLNGKLNEVDSTINVEHLSKGIYYLMVSDNNAIKFIKD